MLNFSPVRYKNSIQIKLGWWITRIQSKNDKNNAKTRVYRARASVPKNSLSI